MTRNEIIKTLNGIVRAKGLVKANGNISGDVIQSLVVDSGQVVALNMEGNWVYPLCELTKDELDVIYESMMSIPQTNRM